MSDRKQAFEIFVHLADLLLGTANVKHPKGEFREYLRRLDDLNSIASSELFPYYLVRVVDGVPQALEEGEVERLVASAEDKGLAAGVRRLTLVKGGPSSIFLSGLILPIFRGFIDDPSVKIMHIGSNGIVTKDFHCIGLFSIEKSLLDYYRNQVFDKLSITK